MNRAEDVLSRMKGPVVPVNICFNEDGTVNYGAVRAYVDWLSEKKTPVILLTGGSSEYAYLSDEEIWRLTAEVATAVAGRSLVIAGTGFWKPSQTREFLRHADSVGVDVVKVQFLNWGEMPVDRIVEYFDLIEGASDIPLMLLSGPQTKEHLGTVAALARRPNIVGIKNDGDPFYDYYELIRSTRDEQFAVVSGGQMRNFVFGFQLGSPAYLCAIAPFRPDLALEFYQLLLDGRYDDAWQFVYRYEEPWLAWAGDNNWMAVMKSCIQLQGLYPNNRPGMMCPPAPPAPLEKVRKKLEETFGAWKT